MSTAKHFSTQKYKIILWNQTKNIDVIFVQEEEFVIVSLPSRKIATVFVLADALMSRTEHKYCSISTSYLTGLFDIFILLHI